MPTAAHQPIHSKGAAIWGREIMPQVDGLIRFESPRQNPNIWERLLPCEVQQPIGEGWPGADFRLTSHNTGLELAVNIVVTGRTFQRYGGELWVRVRVEFVGDCEPSTFVSAWMKV